MECVYKITNIVNNKVYIGRTKEYPTRIEAHKKIAFRNTEKNEKYNRPLYVDMRKFGLNNFVFEVLEYTNNSKELEKSYMELYQSTNREFGYNIIKGDIGDSNVKPNQTFTDQLIDDTIELLMNSDLSYEEIATKQGMSLGYVRDICQGRRSKREGIKYPIRKMLTRLDWENIANNIVDDLINTNLSQKQIANKYGVARSCVTMINIGKNHKKDNLKYPIRK